MDYTFIPINSDNKTSFEILNLFKIVFPHSNRFSLDFIQWQYYDNPDGKVVGYNAYYKNELVAHYALQPMKAFIKGKEEKGLLSLNTATHPAHQGKKLFTKLAEMSYKLATENGFRFVVGVANENSTHGFINKLGFQLVGHLNVRVGIGKIRYNSVNKLQNDSVSFGYDFERSWSPESIKWRLANPNVIYSISDNIVSAPSSRSKVETIVTIFANDGFNTLTKVPLSTTPFLKVWIGVDNLLNWERNFYFKLPNKIAPKALNFIFKDLSGTKRILSFKKVKLHAIDCDAA